ncbi:hypothetical protein EJ08DRAFT_732842 [Tothia fuscella]|uniref:BTB domain-containing protein n=1 Tax=Tothia fuscella TaxID=1048955 RepID=A0A9P4NTV3_9PEZI|nr:hypothetical protein EJ08DRAFT_732842 [Tothia fuscella]
MEHCKFDQPDLATDSLVLVNPLLAGVANLTICVGERNGQPLKRFLVISESMRLASPVWNAMLKPDGPFLENGAKEVSFPEDDPDAFEVIIRITHGQFSTISDISDDHILMSLAFLVDKYELQNLVSAFISRWADSLRLCRDSSLLRREQVLFTAYVFGDCDTFKTALLDLVVNCRVDKQGVILLSGKPVDFRYLPTETTGCVTNNHFAKLEALMRLGTCAIDKLTLCKKNLCIVEDNATPCCGTVMGTMIIALSKIGHWPVPPSVDELAKSVPGFADYLDEHITQYVHTFAEDHEACPAASMYTDAMELMLKESRPLPNTLVQHFQAFAPKETSTTYAKVPTTPKKSKNKRRSSFKRTR